MMSLPDPERRRQTKRIILWTVGIAIALLLFVQFANPGTREEPDSSTSPADQYLGEYGGDRRVYARILGSTDCDFLQEQFDIAADNNDRATPGSDEHRWTLGYMTAADDQLEESGCY
jgi:hypothetical protein